MKNLKPKTKKKRDFWTNPILEELRKIREDHEKQFNYDFDALFDDLLQKQEEMKKQGYKFITEPLKKPDETE
ncbi:MAG: hypothetical protein LBC02_04070 [Planctomycetaceae bacterium]|jgi:hypothetical protein|nr:hypothetical protein [Planctomycetaceae bacterium]